MSAGGPARAVISDFGGVLTSPLIGSFAKFQDNHGIPLDALGKALAAVDEADGAHPLYELEKGEMTERVFLDKIGAALHAQLGRPVEMHRFTEEYWAALTPNEPMISLLAGLRADGVRMAMLTNNVREWEARWRSMLPVDDIFELVVDSAFVGMRKPDPEIYELTLERFGEPAEACLFVDDIEINVQAARALGMTGVHFVTNEQAIPEIQAALGRHA